MIEEWSHLSILAGCQVGFLLRFDADRYRVAEGVLHLIERAGGSRVGGDGDKEGFLLLVTLKELHQLLLQWAAIDSTTAALFAEEAHKRFPSAIRSVEFYCN